MSRARADRRPTGSPGRLSMPVTGTPARSYTSETAPFGNATGGSASVNAAGTVPASKSRLPLPNAIG